MKRIAFYPGTFDPLTSGHLDIITRAAGLFDEVIIGVAQNPSKAPLIQFKDRVLLVEQSLAQAALPAGAVRVMGFDGLTVDVAKQHGASVLLRGVRALSDFEYEFMMAQMNKTLCRELETVFLMAALEHQFVSSSLVKQVAQLGGDVSAYVPPAVASYFKPELISPKP
ncbi:MAG: pantetheine-phosphate adenylyltransferase [Vampirovibrionales bacterium]|nr:pantetheine-phosphate adenylyltransferase [Vampirovibrionales bacterium]